MVSLCLDRYDLESGKCSTHVCFFRNKVALWRWFMKNLSWLLGKVSCTQVQGHKPTENQIKGKIFTTQNIRMSASLNGQRLQFLCQSSLGQWRAVLKGEHHFLVFHTISISFLKNFGLQWMMFCGLSLARIGYFCCVSRFMVTPFTNH